VVNFILRKDYQGAQFTANVGESDQNDGDQSGYSFTFGQTSDKGSISSGQTLGDYHCFGQNDRYNYAAQNLVETPQERTNVFVMGSYNFSDHVSAYMNAYYNKTTSDSELAPANLTSSQGLTLSADSAFNPFGVAFGPNDYLLYTRLNDNRIFSNSTTTGQISTGFKGDFPIGSRNWTWEVGLDYGHESTTTILRGLPNVNTLNEGTGASFVNPATGLVTCGTAAAPISGCLPFNPLNLQSPQSLAALANASTPTNSLAYSIEKVWHAEVSGGLFDLPAGTVQLAAGLSYRTEYLNDKVDAQLQTDPATGLCILGSSCSASEQGSYNVKEGYAELFVPILQDLPGIQSLNVTLGDRYSKFSDFGSTNNAKVSLEWKPINDLLLRGTAAEVFRAPNISEVYGPPSIDYENISVDPCDGYTGAPSNPACKNVPTNGTYKSIYDGGNQQVGVLASGSAYANYPLKPEQGKTFDLGAVYSPSWAPGLSTSVDVWHLYLNNTITSVGVQSLLDLCSSGATQFCPYINRIASGPNQGQLSPTTVTPTVNLGSTSTGGVDFSANYRLPQFDRFGQFSLGLNATYLKYYDVDTAPGTAQNTVYHNAGHFQAYQSAAAADCPGAVGNCLFPRWRGQGYVNWQLGGWDASWRLRYIGRFQNGYNDINQSPFVLKYGATTYNDVSMGYNIEPLNTKIAFGVNNLFDKQPPNLYGNQTLNANTDPSDFDTIGRYFWGRVTVSF
jgi:outer membrane receptor protein involved in Fe transport